MSLWSQKRKTIISATILIPLLFVIGFLYLSTREAPSCFDGVQNNDEAGIDCGGSCIALCQNNTLEPVILWSRFVPVINDVYSVVAMIENPNLNAEAYNAPYSFKLYDEDNILIYERKGSAFIPSGAQIPIFEHALRTGERIPVRSTFEFREDPYWEQASTDGRVLSIVSKNIDEESRLPRLVSVVKNISQKNLHSISFVALLFDKDDNLVNASRTLLENLSPEDSDTLVFTWPESFDREIVKIEIIPVEYTIGQ